MPALSQSRSRGPRRAASEVYAAALLVAVTLALSSVAYSLVDFHVTPAPAYSSSSYSEYGSPSFLHIQVNSSAPTAPAEFRIDGASSLAGFLALTAGGYSSTGDLCSPGETTFFSVSSSAGTIAISGSGSSWIDGVVASTAVVQSGWHEVAIADGSLCAVELPGGVQVSGPSPEISTVPMEAASPQSFVFLVPYFVGGHVATIVFDGGTQVIGF